MQNTSTQQMVKVVESDRDCASIQRGSSTCKSLSLVDDGAMAAIFSSDLVYLDITSLSHRLWAPFVRAALSSNKTLRVVYSEPAEYRRHSAPAAPAQFDLSARFDGVDPLPGFAPISSPSDYNGRLLVALLGFEGNRPFHIGSTLGDIDRTIPIIGSPGFRHDFLSTAVASNSEFLTAYDCNADIRWAAANDPQEALQVIEGVRQDFQGHYLYIAPIGTKPHALGAILAAIRHPLNVEIIYDNPIRKQGRSSGLTTVNVYHINEIMEQTVA